MLLNNALLFYIDEKHRFWHCVMSIGRRVRVCRRLLEVAKALATRDHVRGISGLSTLSNIYSTIDYCGVALRRCVGVALGLLGSSRVKHVV